MPAPKKYGRSAVNAGARHRQDVAFRAFLDVRLERVFVCPADRVAIGEAWVHELLRPYIDASCEGTEWFRFASAAN